MKKNTSKVLMKGNEALAEAAVIAGCRYYFAYPITPQNEIPAYMAKRMPQVGGTFLQAESEIAAVSMVMGASAGGGRVMTSSSSCGISLKQEGISYLAGCQLPCVIVNMMRGGPGLGNIAGSQGDYFQATRGGGNGDYRCIVLAPASAQELADLALQAFDLADRYRMVTMILGDGYLGQMSEPVILPEPSGKSFDKSWALTGAKGREPHTIKSINLSPENSLYDHNMKLDAVCDEVKKNEVRSEEYMVDDADVLLVAYGTASRISRKAVNQMRKEGLKVGLFRPISLYPFPEKAIRKAAEGKKVLTIEMSLGQMVEDVRLSLIGIVNDVDFYGRPGGLLPLVDDIIERVKSYE